MVNNCQFFIGTEFASFRRYLRTYGFDKLGEEVYSHPHFIKDDKDSVSLIKPTIPLPSGEKSQNSADDFPAYYGKDAIIEGFRSTQSRQICFPVKSVYDNDKDKGNDEDNFDARFDEFLNSCGVDKLELEILPAESLTPQKYEDLVESLSLDVLRAKHEQELEMSKKLKQTQPSKGKTTNNKQQNSSVTAKGETDLKSSRDSPVETRKKRKAASEVGSSTSSDSRHKENEVDLVSHSKQEISPQKGFEGVSTRSRADNVLVPPLHDKSERVREKAYIIPLDSQQQMPTHDRNLRSTTRMMYTDETMIGDEYQAVIPPLLPPPGKLERALALKESPCVWSPQSFDTSKIESFVQFVESETISESLRTRVKPGSILVVNTNPDDPPGSAVVSSPAVIVSVDSDQNSDGTKVRAKMFDGEEVGFYQNLSVEIDFSSCLSVVLLIPYGE